MFGTEANTINRLITKVALFLRGKDVYTNTEEKNEEPVDNTMFVYFFLSTRSSFKTASTVSMKSVNLVF